MGGRDDKRINEAENKDQADLTDSKVDCLLDLFVFADACETTALRNDIMSAMRTFCTLANVWPGLRVVPLAFERLLESSTFCRYLIDATTYNRDGTDPYPQYDKVDMSLLRTEFNLAVCRINSARCFDNTGDKELCNKLWDPCAYHEHASEQRKKGCKSRQVGNEPFVRSLLAMCMAAVDTTTASEAHI